MKSALLNKVLAALIAVAFLATGIWHKLSLGSGGRPAIMMIGLTALGIIIGIAFARLLTGVKPAVQLVCASAIIIAAPLIHIVALERPVYSRRDVADWTEEFATWDRGNHVSFGLSRGYRLEYDKNKKLVAPELDALKILIRRGYKTDVIRALADSATRGRISPDGSGVLLKELGDDASKEYLLECFRVTKEQPEFEILISKPESPGGIEKRKSSRSSELISLVGELLKERADLAPLLLEKTAELDPKAAENLKRLNDYYRLPVQPPR